jgi:hypothetical protein
MPRPPRMADCHPDRKHQGKGLCSPCYQKQYYHPHPEVDRKNKLLWRNSETGARYRKDWHTKRRYGISVEEYENLLQSQNNICALCKEQFVGDVSTKAYAPVLDHSHKDEKVRAFIHQQCNKAIGQFKDSAEKCRLAAEYLDRYANKEI